MTSASIVGPDVETASLAYARRFSGRAGQFFLDAQRDAVLELLTLDGPIAGTAALDHGGGHGQLEAALTGAGCDLTITGTDAGCGERLAPSTRFVTTRLEATRFAPRAFDFVVSVRLLAHVDTLEEVVGEMCRIADRAVVVDYPTLRSVNLVSELAFPFKRGVEKDTRRYRVYRDRSIDRCFAAFGFRRRRDIRQFVVPMALHRALGDNGALRTLERALDRIGASRLVGSPVMARFDRVSRDG